MLAGSVHASPAPKPSAGVSQNCSHEYKRKLYTIYRIADGRKVRQFSCTRQRGFLMTDRPVLIVGAGPTGLTAALELARQGVIADIVDKRAAASGFSRAVGITPRSMDILAESGATEALVSAGISIHDLIAYRGQKQILNVSLATNKLKNDFLLALPQDQTEKTLVNFFEQLGGRVEYNKAIRSLIQRGDNVEVFFQDGSMTTYEYVYGADGIHSTVRQTVSLDFPGFDLREKWAIADVDATGWIHPKTFSVYFCGRSQAVIVAPIGTNRYRVISNTHDSIATLPFEMNVTRVRAENSFRVSVRQVKTYQKDRVFLGGDAAHCHSPVGGRGMNLGIADGAEFARRFVTGALEGYSQARYGDAACVIRKTERARHFIMSANPLNHFVIDRLAQSANKSEWAQRTISRALLTD